jgi:hypothetical protein
MASVQSYIRAEVSHGAFPTPNGAETFSAYAIASGKGLVPEIENAAYQTLNYPMTLETLGEGLRLFEGWALRKLASFRRRCRDNLVSCFESFLDFSQPQFDIWVPCNQSGCLHTASSIAEFSSPPWVTELFQRHVNESREGFSRPLFKPQDIRGEYISALNAHISPDDCGSCAGVHIRDGDMLCKELEDRLTQALSEVCTSFTLGKTVRVFNAHLA